MNITEQIQLQQKEAIERLQNRHFIEIEELKRKLNLEELKERQKIIEEAELTKMKLEEEKLEREESKVFKVESEKMLNNIKDKLNVDVIDEALLFKILKYISPKVKRILFQDFDIKKLWECEDEEYEKLVEIEEELCRCLYIRYQKRHEFGSKIKEFNRKNCSPECFWDGLSRRCDCGNARLVFNADEFDRIFVHTY